MNLLLGSLRRTETRSSSPGEGSSGWVEPGCASPRRSPSPEGGRPAVFTGSQASGEQQNDEDDDDDRGSAPKIMVAGAKTVASASQQNDDEEDD